MNYTRREMSINAGLRSNILSGIAAFVIYVVIALATGGVVGLTIGIGVLVGLATFAISYLIRKFLFAGGPRRR